MEENGRSGHAACHNFVFSTCLKKRVLPFLVQMFQTQSFASVIHFSISVGKGQTHVHNNLDCRVISLSRQP